MGGHPRAAIRRYRYKLEYEGFVLRNPAPGFTATVHHIAKQERLHACRTKCIVSDSAMPEGDAAFGEIVRGQLHGNFVACQNPNPVPAEPAGQVGQHDTVMVQLNAK